MDFEDDTATPCRKIDRINGAFIIETVAGKSRRTKLMLRSEIIATKLFNVMLFAAELPAISHCLKISNRRFYILKRALLLILLHYAL